jgi:NADH-quinone oxidoreductase subunit C
MMTMESIFEYLNENLEGVHEYVPAELGQPWITVSAGSWKTIAKFLRDDAELRFNTLMCLSGVHYPDEEALGVTYHLHSTTKGHTLVVKVKVPEEDPVVPSVETIWKTADWHEREAYDMVGVQFEGHPNLRRILTPVDWEGFPLRKDYEQQEFYNGVTTRA